MELVRKMHMVILMAIDTVMVIIINIRIIMAMAMDTVLKKIKSQY